MSGPGAGAASEHATGIGPVGIDALDEVNAIVAAAIATWDLAPRVRRLALPSYLYTPEDLRHLHLLGAWRDGGLAGVVALEHADPAETPAGHTAVLIQGLYVMPGMQRRGLGSRLVGAARRFARDEGVSGLLVRAERGATAFFARQGLSPLPVTDPQRDYPHRLWTSLAR